MEGLLPRRGAFYKLVLTGSVKKARAKPVQPMPRGRIRPTRPDLQVGPFPPNALRQLLDTEPLRRVVARQEQRDVVRLGVEIVVEARLAGEEHVGAGADGVG